MRTGEYWKEYKRREKALETMEVYAPLADRLGIRSIKEELEDISLRFWTRLPMRRLSGCSSSKRRSESVFWTPSGKRYGND